MQIKSTLASVAEAVFSATDVQTAQTLFLSHVSGSGIKAEDRVKMLTEVSKMTSLNQIHRYTANALLKYEGLGL